MLGMRELFDGRQPGLWIADAKLLICPPQHNFAGIKAISAPTGPGKPLKSLQIQCLGSFQPVQ
jgi:hypothetical protein